MILLASDYDNTLNTFKLDLKINIYYLKKFIKEGNIFLLNTGRPYKSIKREIREYNIPYNYLSCNDGNILFNNSDSILYASNISDYIYKDLKQLEDKFKMKIEQIKFLDNVLEFELIISSLNDIFLVELEKIMIKYDLCAKFFKAFGEYHIYVYQNRINKSTPIEYLKAKYKIASDNIYTVGDHINDLEMIRDYNGYAMKWARPEIKKVASNSCFMVASLIKKIGKRR